MNEPSSIGINISVSPKTLMGVYRVIKMILDSECDEDTKKVALGALERATSISHNTISGCSVTYGKRAEE